MKKHSLSLCLLGMALAICPALADTLKTKNGQVLEGKVLEEKPDSVRFQWNPAKGIKDEKWFPRTEIAELKILTADEAAFQGIKHLLTSVDMMTISDYKKVIEEQFKPFLKAHAGKPRAAEVEAALKAHEEELAKVEAGWQKIDGRWISKQELAWNDYNIKARLLRKEAEAELAKKPPNLKGALEAMEKMKKEYPASTTFASSFDFFAQLLQDYQVELTNMLNAQPQLLADRKALWASLPPAEKRDAESKYYEDDKARRQLNVDKKLLGILIPTPDPYTASSIADAQKAVTKAIDDLKKMDRGLYTKAAELVSKGLEAGTKANPIEAHKRLQEASDLLKNDNRLKALVQQWKASADEAMKAMPTKTVPAAVTASPKTQANEPKKDPKDSKAPKESAAKAPADPAAPAKPAFTYAPQQEEETNLGLFMLMGAGALVVIGGVLTLLKKRRLAAEQAEG